MRFGKGRNHSTFFKNCILSRDQKCMCEYFCLVHLFPFAHHFLIHTQLTFIYHPTRQSTQPPPSPWPRLLRALLGLLPDARHQPAFLPVLTRQHKKKSQSPMTTTVRKLSLPTKRSSVPCTPTTTRNPNPNHQMDPLLLSLLPVVLRKMTIA